MVAKNAIIHDMVLEGRCTDKRRMPKKVR